MRHDPGPAAASATSRSLTAAEKYYAFLDQAWPTNPLIVADLDRCFPDEQVAEAWARFCARRVAARLQVTEDLRIIDAGPEQPELTSLDLDPGEWDDVLRREAATAYGFGHALRCRYLRSTPEQRSRVVLVGHHTVVDGRLGVTEMQHFLRALDGQEVPAQTELSAPVNLSGRFAWQDDRRALLALLQEIREEGAALDTPAPTDWPDRDLPRAPRFAPVVFSREESARLLAAGKAQGAGPLPAMAAGWLVAALREVCGAERATIQLNTPVDVGRAPEAPDRPPAIAVGVVAGRYDVDPADPWGLARQVAAGLRRAVDRGEGELFFQLSRVGAVDDVALGTRTVRDAVRQAPPAVSVTNLGVVDPGTDPDWVSWICGYQAPTPNHVAFVSGLGYRGRLVNMVATDDQRVPPEQAASFTAAFFEAIEAMTGEQA